MSAINDSQDLAASWHIRLRHILGEYFDEDDLQVLCFDLQVDYEELPGETKSQKAAALITHMARLDRVAELIDLCSQARPNVPWADLRAAAVENPLVVDELPDEIAAEFAARSRRWGRSLSRRAIGIWLAVGFVVLVSAAWLVYTAVAPDTSLLFADFEEGEAAGWQSISTSSPPPVVALPDGDRALRLQQGVAAFYSPAWEWDTANYRLEADVMVVDLNAETSIGLHARVLSPNDAGYCQGYRAEIGPGHAAIYRITAPNRNCDSEWQFDPLNNGTFTLQPGQWHHLRLDVTGSQLRFFVDDALTLAATDRENTYSTGGVGLMVFSSAEAYVDNVEVTALTANP